MGKDHLIPAPGQRWTGRQPIPAEARDMVAHVGLAYVATVSADGLPNLSPKGTLKVIDEHTLAFGDIASPGTMRNLDYRPYVDINVVDVFRRRGYRFRGPVTVTHDPELIAFLGADLGETYPIRAAIQVTVEETRALVSPIYWVTDTGEDKVIASWERNLGYHRIIDARNSSAPTSEGDPTTDHEIVRPDGAQGAEQFVQRFQEIWAGPIPERFNEIIREDGILLHPGMTAPVPGTAVPAYVKHLVDTFPDITLRVNHWAARKNVVLIEWTIFLTIACQPHRFSGADRFTLRDGRAIEGVAYFDSLPLWALLEPPMTRTMTIDEAASRV